MAIHKFILKSGKGVRTITSDDIELIEKDFTDDIRTQRTILQNISNDFRNKLDNNKVITSNARQITYSSSVAKNDDTYLLTYSADNQNIEFIASSGFPVLGTLRRVVVKLETENTLEFKGQFPSQVVIAPKGKLTTSTGRGNVIEVYLVRTQDSRNLMFLSGDLDETDSSQPPINIPEYTMQIEANQLKLLKDEVEVASEDLSLYLDDSNLARLISGVVDSRTGIATFTRDDNSSFTLDLSSLVQPISNQQDLQSVTDQGGSTTNPIDITRSNSSLAPLMIGLYNPLLAQALELHTDGIRATSNIGIFFNHVDPIYSLGSEIKHAASRLFLRQQTANSSGIITNTRISASDPINGEDLVTKQYADAKYGQGVEGGLGKLETFEVTLTDGDLLFDDTKPLTELIPAIENNVIVIDKISILGNITKGVEQSYANVFITYNKPGYNFELIEVKTDAGKQLQTDTTSWDVDDDLSDLAQSPVSAAIVLKGADGIGTTGLEGVVNVKIIYSYLDVTSIL